jgi:2-iminobutanoate/2-iminopropanoate deaminase
MEKVKKCINAEEAPKAIGPYSHAVKVGDLLYTSGQLGMDPTTGELVDGGVETEARQALLNLGYILKKAECNYSDVIKTLVFLRDMNDFARVNVIYAEFFKENPPARSAVQIAALPKGAAIEIEAVALCHS